MRQTKIDGLSAAHAIITPTCRDGRGIPGAWEEAVRRLRSVYLELLTRQDPPTADFHLVLTVDYPKWKAERQGAPATGEV